MPVRFLTNGKDLIPLEKVPMNDRNKAKISLAQVNFPWQRWNDSVKDVGLPNENESPPPLLKWLELTKWVNLSRWYLIRQTSAAFLSCLPHDDE